MKKRVRFSGIMPAIPTPLDEKGVFQPLGLRALLEEELAAGVSGFYVGGATGEGVVLPVEERMALLKCVADTVKKRADIICHVGAIRTADAIELARHAEACGADGISAMPPDFAYTYTSDELVDYYKTLARATALPVIAYATQKTAVLDITGIMTRLLVETDNVIGVKDTRGNYYKLWQLKNLDGGNINVINGPDECLLAGLAMGADGGIGSTYNLMPEKYVKLFKAFRAGDFAAAREEQNQINRVISVLLEYSGNNVIRSLKLALRWRGFEFGTAAYPASAIPDALAGKFRDALLCSGLELSC